MNVHYPNEYGRLESVILMKPDKKVFDDIIEPKDAMFVELPKFGRLLFEYNCLKSLLQMFGVSVYECLDYKYPNQMFVRDLALVTSDFILIGKTRFPCRNGEGKILKEFLINYLKVNVPVFESPVSMEGADFLILAENTIACSVGNRTDARIAKTLSTISDSAVIPIKALPEGIPQHLLGHKHIIEKDKIAIRNQLHKTAFGYEKVIRFDETDEVTKKYSMNIITIDENVIIMPEDCPETQKTFEENGVKCYTSPMSEITKLGGGFACQ